MFIFFIGEEVLYIWSTTQGDLHLTTCCKRLLGNGRNRKGAYVCTRHQRYCPTRQYSHLDRSWILYSC
jgi:hypothetical protein